MSRAKALSVEMVPTKVWTASVITTCASAEEQGDRRSSDDQKFFRCFHRSHLMVFLSRAFRNIGHSLFTNARSSSAPNNIGDFSLRMHIVSKVICNQSRGIFGEGFIVGLPTNSQINPQNR